MGLISTHHCLVWEMKTGSFPNFFVNKPDQVSGVHQIFSLNIVPNSHPVDRRWFDDERVDLRQFGGQAVDVIFEAGPGPSGNSDFDWGGWSTPVLLDISISGIND